jgi:predicted RNA-binding Zn ribbon-like protein
VTDAIRVRDVLYRCLTSGTDDAACASSVADWQRLGVAINRARARTVLSPGSAPGSPARWVSDHPCGEAVTVDGLCRRAVQAVLLAAGDLVTSDRLGDVAACPGVGCGWLFTDPRRRRRWCSMAVCGNRAKARRHARQLNS